MTDDTRDVLYMLRDVAFWCAAGIVGWLLADWLLIRPAMMLADWWAR
jgi:hypothetical protein